MSSPVPDRDQPAVELTALLHALADDLEDVLRRARSEFSGQPLVVVEAGFARRLEAASPGVRFLGEDIREWSREVAS